MSLRELESELQHWRSAGEPAQLWWRDDDAVTATAQLQRLTQLTGEAGIEVLLASIPAYAERQLADHVAQHQTLKPCVHGWAHANHAPASEKKCELGPHRAIEVVLSDIVRGKQRLEQLFGAILCQYWCRRGTGCAMISHRVCRQSASRRFRPLATNALFPRYRSTAMWT